MVIEAFGRGAITVREFPSMIAAIERMTRTAERIQALREREHKGAAEQTERDGLYSPVNLDADGGTDPRRAANAGRVEEAVSATLAPSLPRERSEPGGGTLFEASDSALQEAPTPDPGRARRTRTRRPVFSC